MDISGTPQTAVTEDMLIGEFQIMGAGYEDGRMPDIPLTWSIDGVDFRFHFDGNYQVTITNPEKFRYQNPRHHEALGIGFEIYRQFYNVTFTIWIYQTGQMDFEQITAGAKIKDEVLRLERLIHSPMWGYLPARYVELISKAMKIAVAKLDKFMKAEMRASASHGYVYLVQSPTGSYKIGRTKDPDNRMKTFSVKLPFEVDYVCVIETGDMYALERNLHQQYATKRVNGEWFMLDTTDVNFIKSLVA